ncbi:MAG TPA: exodeoxyribonuclease VII large subunit [Burkholderiales bacterium]|nr:exodeoxyribonuclease VII large subunit [Burkholderiales bacterium]
MQLFAHTAAVISVSELNRMAKSAIEQALPLAWIGGEVSNFVRAASGHCYFSLKDAAAQVRCVMFRNRFQLLDWQPGDGMQVEVRALPTLYEARGEFQLNVEAMRRSGLGALYAAFERLKAKLAQEGLFDARRKRPLPPFPRCIGIVTSPAAAALRDVLTVLRRRMPSLPVVIYPAPVQGEGAGARLAAAVAAAGARRECDVLIVCRGGGSLEDLWAFNDEALARAIHACPVPVVSGVGHETDFTIADFVADARAPTPTAAAQLACPDRAELAERTALMLRRLRRDMRRALEDRMQQLDHLSRRLTHPAARLVTQRTNLEHLATRLATGLRHGVATSRRDLVELARRLRASSPDTGTLQQEQQEWAQRLRVAYSRGMQERATRLAALQANLAHLNPRAVLERGYGIVRAADGTIVRDGARLAGGDLVGLTFARGWAKARVTDSGGGES